MSKPTRSLEFCRRALEQREHFWAEQAEAIHWQKPFNQVCDFSKPPFARWFVGGATNLCYNAIDRHLVSRPNQPALHYFKTRSGKILRRALHAAAEGKDIGDLSTLEDPIALQAIKELLEGRKKSG
jgi:acetyl-CoA synthetase-like protein